jgi:hypothetical protein
METEPTKPLFGNATYDRTKFVAMILLPALGTLYFALAQIWGLPKAEAVVGTVIALDTFLGFLLKASDVKYRNSDEQYDAAIVKVPGPSGEPMYALEFETRAQQLAAVTKDGLYLKVRP